MKRGRGVLQGKFCSVLVMIVLLNIVLRKNNDVENSARESVA